MDKKPNKAKTAGKPRLDGQPMSAAARQRRARSMAMKKLLDDNIEEVSISGLIAMLPKLISNKHGQLVEAVCKEIIRRTKKG